LNPRHADYDSAALTTWATPPTIRCLSIRLQTVKRHSMGLWHDGLNA